MTVLAVGIATLGMRSLFGGQDPLAAIVLVLDAAILNLVSGLLASRYATSVERHMQ